MEPDSPASQKQNTFRKGRVIRSTGSWYEVQTGKGVVSSKVRGKFRLKEQNTTNPVAVGDEVTIRMNEDDTGLITEIHPRRNKLCRRAAGRRVGREHILVANVDAVWIVQAARLPAPNPGFIDRVLVMAELYDLPAGLVFNKMDLLDDDDYAALDTLIERYRELEYEVLTTSAETGSGVEAFHDRLSGRTSVVTGPSGVGKSTLLNAIEPDLDLRTGDVSEKTRKGRHVTTNATLHPLGEGGYVVDTPGLREFGILYLKPTQLAHYFVEFVPYLNDCRFPDCTHDHEPGCAVRDAVEAGAISEARYESYLNILASVRQGEEDVGR